jgi:tetratricopeptide (TPR) repeat protein
MLSDAVGGVPGFHALDASRVAETVRNWGGVTPDTAARLERELGVGIVVAVRLRPDPSGLVFETTLTSGARVWRTPIAAPGPLPGLERAADWIGGMLGHPGRLLDKGGYPEDALATQLFALARQRFNTLGPPAARSYLETAIDLQPQFARAKTLYGEVLWHAGETAKAGAVWSGTLAELTAGAPPRVRADLLYELIWQQADRGDYDHAEAMLAELARLAAASDDVVPIHLDAGAYLASARGNSKRAVELYRRLVDATASRHDLYYEQVALNNLIDELFGAGLATETQPLIARALALAQVTGDTRTGAHLHLQSARSALAAGDLDAMERECAAALAGAAAERPLAAQVAELRLEARIRTAGVVAALADVDTVVGGFRQLDDRRHAAELRIKTARRLDRSGPQRPRRAASSPTSRATRDRAPATARSRPSEALARSDAEPGSVQEGVDLGAAPPAEPPSTRAPRRAAIASAHARRIESGVAHGDREPFERVPLPCQDGA